MSLSNNNGEYLAIDFGTCNSVISLIQNSDSSINSIQHILDDFSGDILIPTTIYFYKDEIDENLSINDLVYSKHYIIGYGANEALSQQKIYENYFYQFKRFLGINKNSKVINTELLSNFSNIYTLDDETIYFNILINDENINNDNIDNEDKDNNNKYLKISLIDIVKLFFIGLREIISSKLNISNKQKITTAITIPAYFNDLQRNQLKLAVENSGFDIYRIYNEPTAASIYYIKNFYDICDSNKKFIIYDLGGGTIDTTVIEYHYENNTCEILDIDGNSSLGGLDIDNIILRDIYNKYNIDPNNTKLRNKLKKYAEEIKIKLSFSANHNIILEDVPIIQNNEIKVKDKIKLSYSRQYFNMIINDLIDEMLISVINMSKKYEIDNIILIGGPTQIPLLYEKLFSMIKINDVEIAKSVISKNNLLYKTIVADGACLLNKLGRLDNDITLLDIIPMNIGISGQDNKLSVMIKKNSKIPTSVEKTFSTSYDCQRNIDILVYEGNDEVDCMNNSLIGSYKIIGIPPLPKGKILIKLLFKITYNGILNISIIGFKNPFDDNSNSFDYKFNNNIRLISSYMAKDLLKKLLSLKK